MSNSYMSELFNGLPFKIHNLVVRLIKKGKKYLKSLLSYGEIIGHKVKMQIEIEKMKWELKQKYNELGKYVAEKKISKSVTDFSHDSRFLEIVNEVNKIKLYINDRQQERNSRGAKVINRE